MPQFTIIITVLKCEIAGEIEGVKPQINSRLQIFFFFCFVLYWVYLWLNIVRACLFSIFTDFF